jgi:argininosuccinate lyase
MQGVPFRKAHEMVAKAAESGADFEALDAATEEVLGDSLSAYVEREAVEAALDPAQSVALRDSTGGPAPEAVAAGLSAAEETVAADEVTLADERESLAESREKLRAEVSRFG